MPTHPKDWPTHGQATTARDDAAEAAQSGLNSAMKVLDRTDDPIILKALGTIIFCFTKILRLLESQGAKTRPQ